MQAISWLLHKSEKMLAFPQMRRAGLIFFGLAFIAINVYSLLSYPIPQVDEAWIASPALEFIQSGKFGLPIFGDIHGSSYNYVHLGRVYVGALSFVFRIAGIGLLQARLFSLAGLLIGSLFVFKIGREIFGERVGILASFIYLFNWHTFYAGHIVRPEIWVNVGGVATLWAFMRVANSRKPLHAFLLGFIATVITDVYVTAVYYTLTVTFGVFYEFRRRDSWTLIGSYSVGAAIGFGYWLIVHLLPDPSTAIIQWQSLSEGYFQTRIDLSLLIAPLRSIPVYIMSGLLSYSRLSFLEAFYLMSSIIGLLILKREGSVRLLCAGVIFGLTYTYIVSAKALYHLVLFAPILSIVIAAGVKCVAEWIAEHISTTCRLNLQRTVLITIFLPLATVYVVGDLVLAIRSNVLNYDQYSSQLQDLIPENKSILGEGTWWWTFHNQPFTADHYLLWYSLGHPIVSASDTIANVIRERNVQVILLDERISSFYLESGTGDISFYEALSTYSEKYCQLNGIVELPFYGVEQGGPAVKRTQVFLCPSP